MTNLYLLTIHVSLRILLKCCFLFCNFHGVNIYDQSYFFLGQSFRKQSFMKFASFTNGRSHNAFHHELEASWLHLSFMFQESCAKCKSCVRSFKSFANYVELGFTSLNCKEHLASTKLPLKSCFEGFIFRRL